MLDSLPKLHDRGGGVLRHAAHIACLIVVEQYTRLCRWTHTQHILITPLGLHSCLKLQ